MSPLTSQQAEHLKLFKSLSKEDQAIVTRSLQRLHQESNESTNSALVKTLPGRSFSGQERHEMETP